jgi:hypothetical protein
MRSATVNKPVPFVFDFSVDDKKEFEENETFSFELTIFGNAIEYLSYFLYCFNELGKCGIGKNSGKYRMISVECVDSRTVIYMDDKIFTENIEVKTIEESNNIGTNFILGFITPFRAVSNGRLIKEIDFEVVLKNLLRRVDLISYYHCGKKLEIDFKKIINISRNILIEEKSLKYFRWNRIASNNKQKVNMGGYTGYLKGKGDLKDIITYLRLGEIFHIGKGCSFGMGKYKLDII